MGATVSAPTYLVSLSQRGVDLLFALRMGWRVGDDDCRAECERVIEVAGKFRRNAYTFRQPAFHLLSSSLGTQAGLLFLATVALLIPSTIGSRASFSEPARFSQAAWFVGVLVLIVYLMFATALYLLPPSTS